MKNTILAMGFLIAINSAYGTQTRTEIRVEVMHGEKTYIYENSGCEIRWTVHLKTNHNGISHYLRCKRPIEGVVSICSQLLARLKQDFPDTKWQYFFFRRLVRIPEYSVRLAKASHEDPHWRKIASHRHNGYVRDMINSKHLFTEFEEMFRREGIGARVSSVEKVLISQAGKTNLAQLMELAGIPRKRRIIFDALVWFKLETAGD